MKITRLTLFTSLMIVVASQALAYEGMNLEFRWGLIRVGSTMRVTAVQTNRPLILDTVSVRLRILDSTGEIVKELATTLPTPEGSPAASLEFTPKGTTDLFATVLVHGPAVEAEGVRANCALILKKGHEEETIVLYPGVAVVCDSNGSVACTQ